MAGFAPDVIVSGVEEDGFDHLPDRGRRRDAGASAKPRPSPALPEAADAIVVGCDSLLDFDGQSLGKPASPEEARCGGRRCAVAIGVLLTGHCVIDTAVRPVGRRARRNRRALRLTRPTTRSPPTSPPASRCGWRAAFTLDGYAAPFIDGVDGDPGTVTGISLPLFRSLLAELGLDGDGPVGRVTPRSGRFAVDPPVVLAPMAGVTNTAFRRLVPRATAAALYVSEMVTARALVEGNAQDAAHGRAAPKASPSARCSCTASTPS